MTDVELESSLAAFFIPLTILRASLAVMGFIFQFPTMRNDRFDINTSIAEMKGRCITHVKTTGIPYVHEQKSGDRVRSPVFCFYLLTSYTSSNKTIALPKLFFSSAGVVSRDTN